jgi:hypothetical protein
MEDKSNFIIGCPFIENQKNNESLNEEEYQNQENHGDYSDEKAYSNSEETYYDKMNQI